MGLGKKIGEQIQLQNVSLRDFSRKAGIPYSTLYAIINRDNETVKPETLKKIAATLKIPTSALTGNSIIFDTTLADCEINKILAKAENGEGLTTRESILLRKHISDGLQATCDVMSKTLESLQEANLLNSFDQLTADNKNKVISYTQGLLSIQTAEEEITKP